MINRQAVRQLIGGLLLICSLALIFYLTNDTALGASYRAWLYQIDLWEDHAHAPDGRTIYLPLVSR
ncbi:MAG TPA: hypothetical protein PKE45_22205 [Caldilineaceae bacterium]|nr:hypothetical protein [Caldilineaceae bacterium]